MKHLKLLLIPIIVSVLIYSCEESTPDSLSEDTPAQILADDNLSEILLDYSVSASTGGFLEINSINIGGRESIGFIDFECDSVVIDRETQTIIIDFGTGCAQNEITFAGKVFINFEVVQGFFVGSKTIMTFENFFINDVQVDGTIITTLESLDIENKIITQSVQLKEGALTFLDGSTITRNATQSRKIDVENQKVFITEATASGKTKLGLSYNSSVTKELIHDFSCYREGILVPSAGTRILTVQKTIEIDYGSEDVCDNLATMTVDGASSEVEVYF